MSHNEKLIDGIPIKYVCQPYPECKAKLEAAEEMAEEMRIIADFTNGYGDVAGIVCKRARAAVALWEKGGKKEP